MKKTIASIAALIGLIVSVQQSVIARDDVTEATINQILESIDAPKEEKKKDTPSANAAPAETKQAVLREEDLASFPFDHNILPVEYLNFLNDSSCDLRKVGEALMERKKQFMLRWEDPSKYKDVGKFPSSSDEIELLCIFPEKYIDSLLSKGQLNLHQVKHSRGVCDAAVRAHAEDFMVGIHLENKYNEDPACHLQFLRPKYGFVNFLKPSGIKVNPYRLLQYGTVIIVYNDDVKRRSSYTFGDSLASYCEAWEITLHPLDPRPTTMLRPPGEDDFANCRYVEAQIWGPVELKDIKEFRIPADRSDLLSLLSKSGKPVFSYDRNIMESNDYFMDVSECGWTRGQALNDAAKAIVKSSQVAAK